MKKALILTICFLCLAFSVSDLSGLKFLILNRLNEYATEKYPEKIYIQTDKPYYTAGEDIWYNTYLVNGVTHTETNKSNVIYVELIDNNDNIISERKLFTESISAEGDFKLPLDLKEGTYLLRAYTNYMRNQPKYFFFKKEIPVFALNENSQDSNNNNESEETKTSILPEIGFYPEGGYLVSGMSNKVAVKIKGANLSANPVVGIIEDAQGNQITDFKTFEFGLGSFYINPEPGKEYRAVISSANEDIVYPLPVPLEKGFVINTSIDEKEVLINISTNKEEGLKNTLVIGQQRGLAVFDYTQYQDKKSMLLKIPKDDLKEGILDIVLFNGSKKPVAERLAYIKKEENISISVEKTNGTSTTTRDKVNLEIELKNSQGRLIPGTYSVSVTDAELIKPNNNSENIKTWLLLNSDLRGKIKSPNYFFTAGDTIKKNQLLDLTMLTHGWRRFTWQELLEKSPFQEFKPEEGIYISGKTIDSKSPFQNKISETKLTFRKGGFYQETQKTDKSGHFSYGPFVFNDTIDVYFNAGEAISSEKPNFGDTNIILNPPKQKPSIIPNRVINPFNQEVLNIETYRKKTQKNIFRNFKYDGDRELLDEVKLEGKVTSEEEIKEAARNKRTRFFAPSHRVVVDEFGMHGANDFMELIANIPGVRIGRKQGYLNQTSQDFEVNLRGLKPAFYLDNVKVDLLTARSVPQTDIDFIDVHNTGQASGGYALEAQGIIAIYTKRGQRDKADISDRKPGSVNFNASGFYNAREFYAPDYSLIDRNRSREDRRTTLFWKPNIVTNGYRNAEVSFYTSDEKGRIQIEIQGITETGIPFYKTDFLEVE